MAAAQAMLNNYLQNTILIGEAATRTALNLQGLDSFDSFLGLSDDDISGICKAVRRPGGTTYDAAGNTIPNPGIMIGCAKVKLMRQLRLFFHYLHTVQRPFQPAHATLPRLVSSWRFYEATKEEDDAKETPSLVTKFEDVRKKVEDIDRWLLTKHGERFAKLSYIVQDDQNAPAIVDDPDIGRSNFEDELV